MPTTTKHPRLWDRKTRDKSRENPLRTFRETYGISQPLLARLLDVSVRTISGLECGAVESAQVRRNFTQIARLCKRLGEAIREEYIGRWLDEPNDLLGGLKPVEAIERGQLDLVWQVAEGLRSGSQL
jgi:transcriptional regulator with XRE-family HTH domain